MGIPFEVTDRISTEGWTFLSDFDARALDAKDMRVDPRRLVCRSGLENVSSEMRAVEESLPALWALKRDVIEAGLDVPYVVEEKPVVCAWYPSVNSVLLWNLSEEMEMFHLQCPQKAMPIEVEALDVALVAL